MEVFSAWMSENPKMAAVAVVFGLVLLGFVRIIMVGDKAEAARRDSEDGAKDHHNDMIADNRSAESDLNRSRQSVHEWIKKVRGGK